MPTKQVVSLDRAADYFVNYMFDEYKGSMHVRRVATWLGLLLLAIERVADDGLARKRIRQIVFTYRGRRFKARYNHKAGLRGGIEFVECLSGRGSKDGEVAITVTNLKEAERVYRRLGKLLDEFIDA
jgi:hypothetical protein